MRRLGPAVKLPAALASLGPEVHIYPMQEQKQPKAKSRARASALNPLSARSELRSCSWPGCADEGKFRAPKSRQYLNSYHWFCLDHVKAYNTSWNYYAGMTEAEVEADLRHDTVWQRPSWRWGTGGAANEDMLRAAVNMHAFGPDGADANPSPPYRRRAGVETETDKAMDVLGLKPPLTR
ncbi:MAG: hypothetical protein AAB223_05935, partial [Pseudomonadota bacterium]